MRAVTATSAVSGLMSAPMMARAYASVWNSPVTSSGSNWRVLVERFSSCTYLSKPSGSMLRWRASLTGFHGLWKRSPVAKKVSRSSANAFDGRFFAVSTWPTYCGVQPSFSASSFPLSPAMERRISSAMPNARIAGASYGSRCAGIPRPPGLPPDRVRARFREGCQGFVAHRNRPCECRHRKCETERTGQVVGLYTSDDIHAYVKWAGRLGDVGWPLGADDVDDVDELVRSIAKVVGAPTREAK